MNSHLYVKTREEWRDWLSANHLMVKEVWLVFFKKETGQPGVSYDDSVEEALCFGWIDSIIKKVDDEKYVRKFTPRTSGAPWSASNRERAERMIRAGKMTPVGLAKIEEAKKTGRWLSPPTARRQWEMPDEFKQALAASPQAAENFGKMAPSYKRQFIGWIASARQSVTRSKRSREAIAVLERNEKLGLK